jgi:hypothetical protein
LPRGATPDLHQLDFSQAEDANADFYARLAEHLAQPIAVGKRRQMAYIINQLASEVQHRLDDERASQPARVLLVHGLQRARDLRQEDAYSSPFSDDPAPAANPAQQFAAILRDGPEVGVHTLVWCSYAANSTM